MSIRNMFSSAVSLLQDQDLIKDLYFPKWGVTLRASAKYKENLGTSERGSRAELAKVLIEIKELENSGVEIKYDTIIEMDGLTWKIIQQESKNEVFQIFSMRNDSRLAVK